MSSVIKTRTVASATETAIQMSNSTFARLVTLPVGWTKVRIGCRMWFGDLGSNPGSTPRFAVGLCSGTTNIIGDVSCDNAIGVITNSATWARGGAGYAPVDAATFKKVGSTLTVGSSVANNGNMALPFVNAGSPSRQFWLVDITKGSPNYIVTLFYWAPGNTGDTLASDFYNASIIPAPPTTIGTAGSSYAQGTGVNVAFDEVAGTLNAVGLWFNRADFLAEVMDLDVVPLA